MNNVFMQKKMNDINDDIEQANFVILSLIRKLYVLCEKSTGEENLKYQKEIKQLQKDLRHLDQPNVFEKVKKIYIPYLKEMMETKVE